MFCGKCGTKNDDHAAFCINCGEKLNNGKLPKNTSVSQTNASPANSRNKKVGIIAIVVVLVIIIGILSLVGVGKNRYVGYYILDTGNGFDSVYALCINKDGTAIYSSNKMNWKCSIGYTEKDENCVALYFNQHYNPEAYVEKYCPLYVTLSEDGQRMYLSSDNPNWITDTFDVVDKDTYELFVQEHNLIISLEK